MNETISLTFSSSVENHKGMEIIGNQMTSGLTAKECYELAARFPDCSEVIKLNDLLNEEVLRSEASIQQPPGSFR